MGPPVLTELSILVPVGLADLAPSGPSIHVPMEQAIHVPLTLCANEGIQLCAKGITHPCISRASCLSANGCLPCVKWDFQSLCQWSVPLSASVISNIFAYWAHPCMCQLGYNLGASNVSVLVPMTLSLWDHPSMYLDVLVPVGLSNPLTIGLFISATVDPSISVPMGPTIHVPVSGAFIRRSLPM